MQKAHTKATGIIQINSKIPITYNIYKNTTNIGKGTDH